MSTPFEVLGLGPWADPDEIRSAYRSLVKKCHPDMVQDPVRKKEAQERMVRLNLAYEEALRLASPRPQPAVIREISTADAVMMAARMLEKKDPQGALRQLMRADTKDDTWFFAQGNVLMAMDQYGAAHQSYREAIRRSPENIEYRRHALDASLAMQREKTLPGRVQKIFRNLKKK